MVNQIQKRNKWDYPIYTVRFEGDKLPVYARPDVNHCVLLFNTIIDAERYIEQSADLDPSSRLDVVALNGQRDIHELLLKLPSSIDHVIWDASLQAGYYRMAPISEVLSVVSDFSEEL